MIVSFWGKGVNMSDVDLGIKTIRPEDFAALDFSKVTVLDLRESAEVLVHPIEHAINIPFSSISKEISNLPKDKPVYVICRTGDFSEAVTDILTDRGYDACNVLGGYQTYQLVLQESVVYVDAKGLKCPGPIVKVSDTIKELKQGQRIRVEATEDAFASDITVWCERTGNKLVSLEVTSCKIEALIEKSQTGEQKEPAKDSVTERLNGKTFVIFSGDLDKTIAAFIMANGAASMGREVTLFFTFWGLNILRRSKKVRVKKNVVEKMFGFMMPRGTKKLGLSRMNMGGAGAKMIRWIMKEKNILSLEELIQSAIDHGVHLVACQMSMDIMGIRKEELIDGVELGGVSTFLGSGEKSDMSLFI
jgi:peroxiredoxin family protein/TusA-related sulfurtransferase/rhodanese-related sulfurtransferase